MTNMYSVVIFVEVNANAGAMIFGIYVILVVKKDTAKLHKYTKLFNVLVENSPVLRIVSASVH